MFSYDTIENDINYKRIYEECSYRNTMVAPLSCGYVATATRARNPAVTTGPPTAAHRDPIIRTFQRNAGLFASFGSFF